MSVERESATDLIAEFRAIHDLSAANLRRHHLFVYRLILNQLCIHIGLALTSFNGEHGSPLWFYVNETVGFLVLGTVHSCVATLMAIGLWRYPPAVLGALLGSVGVYLLKLGLMGGAIIRSWVDPGVRDISGETFVFTLSLALMAMATYWECYRIRYPRKVK